MLENKLKEKENRTQQKRNKQIYKQQNNQHREKLQNKKGEHILRKKRMGLNWEVWKTILNIWEFLINSKANKNISPDHKMISLGRKSISLDVRIYQSLWTNYPHWEKKQSAMIDDRKKSALIDTTLSLGTKFYQPWLKV